MQKMAASMGGGMPGMPPGGAEQLKNMTADDIKRASEEMSKMSPDQFKNQMNTAMNQQKAQQDYAMSGSEQLKKDGNKLVGEGKYNDAIEKYMRVKNNLQDNASPAARSLRVSCMLNMSLCFNKTNRHNSAISECTEVLKMDGKSLKAYYRRGQAHAAKQDFAAAVADLRRAVKLAPGDETVEAELTKAVSDLKANGGEDDGVVPEFENGGASNASAGAAAGPMGMSPDLMSKAQEAMKDPDFMANASEMMENMSEEQLEAMSAMAPGGMPKVDPKMAKQAAQMMKNMKPEAMEGMMKMAQEMKDAGMDPASAGGAPSADMMSKMAEKMKDPAMQEAMTDMMKNISPEQLKEMSAASGMQMSDEQAEQTAKMMQSISPETMRRMMTAGTYLQGVFSRARAVYQWVTRNKMFAASVAVLGVATFISYLMRWGVFAVEPAAPTVAGAASAAKGEDEDPWAQDREF